MITSGFRLGRTICRRSRWNICAGSVGTQTWMLSCAHNWRKRSRRAEECSGPCPSNRMRQQQGQAALAPPFGLAAGDELVDHHLCAIGEVAELRFPHHQGVRVGGGVAVLECQHRFFRQQRIDDGEIALPRREYDRAGYRRRSGVARASGRATRHGGGRRCRARNPGPTPARCTPVSSRLAYARCSA